MIEKYKYMFALVLTTVGCGQDPFVGTWEGNLDPKVDLVITSESNDKYSGQGHVYWHTTLCPVEISGEKETDSTMKTTYTLYRLGENICIDGSISDVKCSLLNDNSRMKCEIPNGTTLVYNKEE